MKKKLVPRHHSMSYSGQLLRLLDRGAGCRLPLPRLHCSCALPLQTSSALTPEWGCPGAPPGLLLPRLRPICYLLIRPRPRAQRGDRHPLRGGERVVGAARARPATTKRKQLSEIKNNH